MECKKQQVRPRRGHTKSNPSWELAREKTFIAMQGQRKTIYESLSLLSAAVGYVVRQYTVDWSYRMEAVVNSYVKEPKGVPDKCVHWILLVLCRKDLLWWKASVQSRRKFCVKFIHFAQVGGGGAVKYNLFYFTIKWKSLFCLNLAILRLG